MPRAELPRKLGVIDATAIVIGTVIGSAIFLVPNAVARSLPSVPLILMVWSLTGVLSFFGALAYAELGAMIPDTGGQYVYLREAYGPLVGFLSGWASFLVMQSGGIAALAAGFSIYLSYFVPLSPVAAKLASVLLIAALTAVNYRGRAAGRGSAARVYFPEAGRPDDHRGERIPRSAACGSGGGANGWPGFSWSSFGVAMVACLWAYEGWNCISFAAGEVKRPERNLLLALGLGTAALIAIYLSANIAYMRVLSGADDCDDGPCSGDGGGNDHGADRRKAGFAHDSALDHRRVERGHPHVCPDLLCAGARRAVLPGRGPRASAIRDAARGNCGAGRLGGGAGGQRVVRDPCSRT